MLGRMSARAPGTQETPITSVEELVALIGVPSERVAKKSRPALHARDREWLAASPFCVLATADSHGRCDASPKGDPPGRLVHVLDETTIAIGERPGNRLAYGYRNILENGHVGLISLLPGRGDTLRINGRARLVADAPFFEALVVKGHRPLLAIVIDIEEVFHHCAKSLMRAELWSPDSWRPDALPSFARLAKELIAPDADLAELEQRYGPSYVERLYREPPRAETHPDA